MALYRTLYMCSYKSITHVCVSIYIYILYIIYIMFHQFSFNQQPVATFDMSLFSKMHWEANGGRKKLMSTT